MVGVVSFGKEIPVPTMWAHRARNTDILVWYDTEALNTLGFGLRAVVLSESAPVCQSRGGDAIRLSVVDREDMQRELRAGRDGGGFPIRTNADLAEFGAGWQSL